MYIIASELSRRAEAYCSGLVCVSVCPSVTAVAASVFIYTCNQRYSEVSLRILTRGFSEKPSVQKLWREKGNMQMITVSRFRALSG